MQTSAAVHAGITFDMTQKNLFCIIIYLSFLNCGWLLIREVQYIGILTVNFCTGTRISLCPVEPLYFSDEKSTTVEKW